MHIPLALYFRVDFSLPNKPFYGCKASFFPMCTAILISALLLCPKMYAQEGSDIFWASVSGIHKTSLASYTGANLAGMEETILRVFVAAPEGITLDPENGKMYWVDQGTRFIARANIDGSEVEAISPLVYANCSTHLRPASRTVFMLASKWAR